MNGKEIGINANSSYKTGIGNDGSSVYNTEVGENSSTTKNVYGIYDMSGGSSEYVATCYVGNANKLTENVDVTFISKYVDVYNDYNSAKYGDAVFETSSNSADLNSWFSYYSYFINSSVPLFLRGGFYNDGFRAGLFCFYYYDGGVNNDSSFRPVCIVK